LELLVAQHEGSAACKNFCLKAIWNIVMVFNENVPWAAAPAYFRKKGMNSLEFQYVV